jgi:hypothetical protein
MTPGKLAALRAAESGGLLHSVYGGYDWRTDGASSRRCTQQVAALKLAGLLRLAPRRRGHEHRGQPYMLTDAGREVLARHQDH